MGIHSHSCGMTACAQRTQAIRHRGFHGSGRDCHCSFPQVVFWPLSSPTERNIRILASKSVCPKSLRLVLLEIRKEGLWMTAVVVGQAKAHRDHQCHQCNKKLIQGEATF